MLRNRSDFPRSGAQRLDQVFQRVVHLVDGTVQVVRDLLDRLLQGGPASAPAGIALLGQPDEVRAPVGGIRDALGVPVLDDAADAVRHGRQGDAGALGQLARGQRPEGADHAERSVEVGVHVLDGEIAVEQSRDQLTGDPDVEQERPGTWRRAHAARRSCSSSETSGRANTSTALVSVTTLSPASSILSRSRVSGMSPGSRSVTSAFTFMSPIGTCTLGRRIPRPRFSRSQNSFQLTASGPPTSNVRSTAASTSTAFAKYVPTSSAQIGWMRCVPRPTIGVTGASRASFANVGRMPPSLPKMKLGRKTT